MRRFVRPGIRGAIVLSPNAALAQAATRRKIVPTMGLVGAGRMSITISISVKLIRQPLAHLKVRRFRDRTGEMRSDLGRR